MRFVEGLRALVLVVVALESTAAVAQSEGAAGEPVAQESRLMQGSYIAPLLSYVKVDKDAKFDDGFGGDLAAGYRKGWWAVEASAVMNSWKKGKGGMDVVGGTINGLIFPGSDNFFLLVGAGGLDIDHSPKVGKEYSLTTVEGGLGYILPLSVARYDFGIRADARYRYGHREKRVEPDGDYDLDRNFGDILFNLGLQLPLGLRPEPPPAPVAPLVVVPPAAICSDTLDNDGDGLVDYPADPGCAAADDGDETDPPQCSDGKDNDGDGLVDFPADKGCSAADDNDETDPCKTPAPGERITLKGCGTGDTIVLRGVNFDFDKATLTANAKTILDNVGEELAAYPEIKVELSGHTDAKGSDEYNQKLSERRAASVLKYLATKGIAADRMTSIGYGESKPVADNESDEGRELNRRVELRVTEGVAGVGSPAASVDAGAMAAPGVANPQ